MLGQDKTLEEVIMIRKRLVELEEKIEKLSLDKPMNIVVVTENENGELVNMQDNTIVYPKDKLTGKVKEGYLSEPNTLVINVVGDLTQIAEMKQDDDLLS